MTLQPCQREASGPVRHDPEPRRFLDRVFRAAVLLWVAAAVAGALVGMRAFLGVALGGALAVTMFGIQRRLAYCCLSRAVSGDWCRLPALGAGLFYLLRADAASLPALCFGVGVVPMAVIIAAVRPGDEL